jgi:HSP20 family protein
MAKQSVRERTDEQGQQGQPQGEQQPMRPGSGQSVARRDAAPPAPGLPLMSPFALMGRFIEDLDRLFEDIGLAGPRIDVAARRTDPPAVWVPPVELTHQDGELVIFADIPGMNADQITVEIEDGQLVISGERRQEREERRGGVYRSERVYGTFYRVVPLPDGADPARATATFTNGVLEIRMPAVQRSEARRIQVQEGAQNREPDRQEGAQSREAQRQAGAGAASSQS